MSPLAAPGPGVDLASYGPILVAAGSVVAALVAALGRRDKKASDTATQMDARTKTALDALTESLDRCTAERDRAIARAEAAEKSNDDLRNSLHEQSAQIELLRDQLAEVVGVRRPTKKAAAKKAAPRKGTSRGR